MVMMMVRGEPDYVDQVPRRMAYEAGHPQAEIIYLGNFWQAIIRDDDDERHSMTVITRSSLKRLLDRLEQIWP